MLHGGWEIKNVGGEPNKLLCSSQPALRPEGTIQQVKAAPAGVRQPVSKWAAMVVVPAQLAATKTGAMLR